MLSLCSNFTEELELVPSTKIRKYCCWKPPPQGYLKFNVDGAMLFYQHKTGIGVVLRDENADIVMAVSNIENEVNEPEDIELLAMFRGLQICASMGIQKLSLESNSMMMVNEVQAIGDSSSMLGNLVREIPNLQNLYLFGDCMVPHENMLGNEVAHKLARYARNVESLEMWWENIPEFVSQDSSCLA